CVPTRSQRIDPGGDADDDGVPPIGVDGGDGEGDAPTLKPHAVLGVDPPHGPFSGGTLVAVRGNGFRSNARVFFAGAELPQTHVLVPAHRRPRLRTPPGGPAPADVVVQNGDDESTRAGLSGGFAYDDLYLDPSSGPTSGGTAVLVHAYAPVFDDATRVEIDR